MLKNWKYSILCILFLLEVCSWLVKYFKELSKDDCNIDQKHEHIHKILSAPSRFSKSVEEVLEFLLAISKNHDTNTENFIEFFEGIQFEIFNYQIFSTLRR